MGVDLCAVFATGRGQAEGFAGPVQVGIPIGAFQRQAFTDGRFVDLDDFDACFFQIQYFVVQSQCDLFAHGSAWNVVADERPLQDGYRTGQHAFHRAFGQALCVSRPSDSHGFWAAYVTEDNRWFHAA